MWILFIISLLVSGSVDHDIHLSKSEVNYDSNTQSVQVSISIFLDDLEVALNAKGIPEAKLFSAYEVENADSVIADYLSDKLRFAQNGNLMNSVFIGREMSEDLSAIWCYIEIPDIELGQSLSVTNSIFMEIYDDQKHVMVITKDHKRVDHWIIDEAPYTEKIRF